MLRTQVREAVMAELGKRFDEKELIARVLTECNGDISQAAQRLQIDAIWVRRKTTEHGLENLVAPRSR
jgi:DNA-binding NtrC family response regulator